MALFPGFETVLELPWTFSYVIRKRLQVDNLNELPKEKRPPEHMIWYGTPDDIENWIDKIYDRKGPEKEDFAFIVPEEIE